MLCQILSAILNARAMRFCSLDDILSVVATERHFLTDLTTSLMILFARSGLIRKDSATSWASSKFWELSDSEILSFRPSPFATGLIS